MKPGTAFVIFVLILQASAFSSQNALDFAEGIAVGIIDEVPRNITECQQDVNSLRRTFDAYDKGFQELSKGLHFINGNELVQGLKDIGAGLQNTSAMLVECGIIDATLGIGSVSSKIYNREFIRIVTDVALAELFHEDHPITAHIESAIEAWRNEKFYESGKYVGSVIGLILMGFNPIQYEFLYENGYKYAAQMFDISEIALDWTKNTAGKAAGTVAEGVTDVAGKAADGAKDVAGKVAEGAKDTAGKVADAAKDAAGKVADKAKDAAGKVAEGAKDAAGTVAEGAKDTAGKVADKAKDAAGKVAEGAKDAASKVGGWFGF